METLDVKAQNIIVRMPNWVGDCVMATVVLKDLKKAFPKSKITAMIKTPLSDLLLEDPNVDEIFSFTKTRAQLLQRQESKDIVQKIKNGNFDLGILLTNSFSSAWMFWLGNVQRIIGYSSWATRCLLTDPVAVSKEKIHQVDKYKNLLNVLGIRKTFTKPSLYLKTDEIEEAKNILRSVGYQDRKKIVGINPGASYGSAKCWLPERFRELALKLAQMDCYVVFFGDSKTSSLVKEICHGLPSNVLDLSLKTDLRQLCSLISICDVFVTNDSGPMHIADCFEIPLVALFGSTDQQVTGPYRGSLSVLNKKVSCSPCLKRVCPIDFRCMKEISVEDVFLQVKKYV